MKFRESIASVVFLLCGCTSSHQSSAVDVAHHDRSAIETPTCDSNRITRFERARSGVPEVTHQWLKTHRCAVNVIDIREEDELIDGSIPGAEWVSASRVLDDPDAIEQEKPTVFVCRSGRRSGVLVAELERHGFKDVASLSGGMIAWKAAGFGVASAFRAVHQEDRPSKPISLRSHVADEHGEVHVASLFHQGSLACVDGRDQDAVIGTPGGDAGEFVLGVSSLEKTLGRIMREDEVTTLFDAYLHEFGRFYLHSDSHAAKHVAAHFELETSNLEVIERWMRHPPRAKESELLSLLGNADFVGCGHLKLMLKYPHQYEIRPDIVRQVLRLFFQHLWSHPQSVEFVVLSGEHHEQAVIDVKIDGPLRTFSYIPRIPPRIGEHQVFVLHSDAIRFLRKHNGLFFSDHLHLKDEETIRFMKEITRLGGVHLGETAKHLAKGLPVWEAHFRDEHLDHFVKVRE